MVPLSGKLSPSKFSPLDESSYFLAGSSTIFPAGSLDSLQEEGKEDKLSVLGYLSLSLPCLFHGILLEFFCGSDHNHISGLFRSLLAGNSSSFFVYSLLNSQLFC